MMIMTDFWTFEAADQCVDGAELIGRNFVITHPFQTVVFFFALDIIDFD